MHLKGTPVDYTKIKIFLKLANLMIQATIFQRPIQVTIGGARKVKWNTHNNLLHACQTTTRLGGRKKYSKQS